MPCFVVPATRQPLTPEPLDPGQVVSGNPQVSTHEIVDSDALAIGIWEHTAGVSTDVEVDEVFVVLVGRATIAVAGGPTLEVGPGDVGVLEAGAKTTWTVHETLRKIYVIAGQQ
ncbi:MAG TPA: cupin domain-containing protein [Actinomycetes bacterium]|nr:cupin domain-containing protein [Actinomycetes bacterium]